MSIFLHQLLKSVHSTHLSLTPVSHRGPPFVSPLSHLLPRWEETCNPSVLVRCYMLYSTGLQYNLYHCGCCRLLVRCVFVVIVVSNQFQRIQMRHQRNYCPQATFPLLRRHHPPHHHYFPPPPFPPFQFADIHLYIHLPKPSIRLPPKTLARRRHCLSVSLTSAKAVQK